MIAAIAAETRGKGEAIRHDQLEMVFDEIHKQAMANVLLDITGRIGTRQRDASATAPQRDARAAAVITSQAVTDFSNYGKIGRYRACLRGNAVQFCLSFDRATLSTIIFAVLSFFLPFL